MLRKMKDTVLSYIAKIATNKHICKYGEIVKLNLNSNFKTMDMDVLLDDENKRFKIQVKHYEITGCNT